MHRQLKTALWIVALIVSITVGHMRTVSAEGRARVEQLRADSIAFEGVLDRARDDWAIAAGEREADLTARLAQERDSAVAALAGDLQAARGRVRQAVGLQAAAEGRLRAVADSLSLLAPDPDSVAGTFDDGQLIGAWSYLYGPRELVIPWYRATFGAELYTIEGGDGRVAVAARATDPRVTLDVTRLVFDPPEPVTVRKSSWRGLATAGLVGAAVCAVVCR